MPVKSFELFHGAVLTKLVRSDRPVTLRLIETGSQGPWGMYRINDEVNLLLKYSTTPKAREGATRWDFVVSRREMKELSNEATWLALVCGSSELRSTGMETCLLDPRQLKALFHLKGWQESAYVERKQRTSLRVGPTRAGPELVIARNRVETWKVPGS
jgi:hypothetical protein